MVQINTSYPATPFLAAYLRQHGVDVIQEDLSLALTLQLFSRSGLKQIAAHLLRNTRVASTFSAAVAFFLANRHRYLSTVDEVIRFLQGKAPALATRIAGRRWLPEGPRFELLHEMERLRCLGMTSLPGRSGGNAAAPTEEKARLVASLYLDDLADVIKDGIDPRFAFARYGEKLAVSAPYFDSILRALKAEPTVVDRMLDALTDKALATHAPDVVAITAPFPGTVYGAFRIAQRAKRSQHTVWTVLGGGYVNTELRDISDPRVFDFFDFIVLDDGEIPLLRLVEYISGLRPASQLVRVLMRCGRRIRRCQPESAAALLHRDRPPPSYSDLPLDLYVPLKETLNPMLALWSERRWNKLMLAHGCYWRRCAFCDTALPYIRRYDPAPVETIVKWIKAIIAETNCRDFHFVDEAAPPAILRKLAEELIRRDLKITWWGNIRLERAFSRELAALMAASGCIAVTGAMETASGRTLKLMEKGVTLEEGARVAHNLASAGILVHLYLMYGFPSETDQETIDGLEYVRQLFASGLVHSAYWHRFALTVHSSICRSPARFGIRIHRIPRATFARNEIPYHDPASSSADRLGPGLRKAVYNFMHGVGLTADVREWFDQPVPSPSIPQTFVARAIAHDGAVSRPKMPQNARALSQLPDFAITPGAADVRGKTGRSLRIRQ